MREALIPQLESVELHVFVSSTATRAQVNAQDYSSRPSLTGARITHKRQHCWLVVDTPCESLAILQPVSALLGWLRSVSAVG